MLGKRISEVTTLIKHGKYSVTELCEECLSRMDKLRFLNMFITEVPEMARKQAKEIENSVFKTNADRSFHGIPVSVKDNFSTKNIRTTCASLMLKDYVPPYNATVVDKLLDSGSIVIGKTNMDEFAMGCGSVDGAFGPVKNPWSFVRSEVGKNEKKRGSDDDNGGNGDAPDDDIGNGWVIAGGSSGGSAVAVAVGASFAALGSDTGGSSRNPSSYCGVVGLKPTYGRLSRHGLIPLVNSMDVPGIICRNVDDVALMLNVLSGRDPLDSTTVSNDSKKVELPECPEVKGLTVGIPKEYNCSGLSKEVIELWRRAADKLSVGGAKVKEVSLPHTDLSIACYHVLCACEVASNMARYDGLRYGHRSTEERSTESMYALTRHEAFNDVVRSRILAGNYFLLKNNFEKYYVRAQKIRRLIHDDFVKVYESGVDLLLTPTVLSDAPEYDWFAKADNRTRTAEQDVCTEPANMAGVPAVSVPVGFSERSLPIGMQLIGRHFDEVTLLKAAKYLEQQFQFPQLIDNSRFNLLLNK